jgi:hypothetical protein
MHMLATNARAVHNMGMARRAWRATTAPSADEPLEEGTVLSS